MLTSEDVYALAGTSNRPSVPSASCPAYTSVAVFLLVLYFFFVAMTYAIRPTWMRKAGSSPTDPNNLDMTAAFLYSLLWTAIVLVVIGLIVRCRRCL